MIDAMIHSHCRKLEAPPLHSDHTTKSIYSNSPLVINLIFHYWYLQVLTSVVHVEYLLLQRSCQNGVKLYSQYFLDFSLGEGLHRYRTWKFMYITMISFSSIIYAILNEKKKENCHRLQVIVFTYILKPFHFQDLIGNSPYCLTCNS